MRLLTMAVTLFGVAVVVFVVIRIAPGDPIAMMLPPGATQADIDRLRALYGLDKGIVEQFFIWLAGVAHGDFGTSISLRQDVLGLVMNRLPATLELSIVALLIAVAIGGPLAIIGARERGTAVEAGIDVANGAALSIPDFLWGLVFILLFGVLMPVFEISGRVSPLRAGNGPVVDAVLEHFLDDLLDRFSALEQHRSGQNRHKLERLGLLDDDLSRGELVASNHLRHRTPPGVTYCGTA